MKDDFFILNERYFFDAAPQLIRVRYFNCDVFIMHALILHEGGRESI